MIDQIPASALVPFRTTPRSTRAGKPLVLRRLGIEEVRYLNQVASNRLPVEFVWLDRQWSLRLIPLNSPSPGHMRELSADWGNASVRIRLDSIVFDTAVGQFVSPEILNGMPHELQLVLIEAAFEGVLSKIETATRKRCSLISPLGLIDDQGSHDAQQRGCTNGFQIQLDDGENSCSAELWLDTLGLGFLASVMKRWPPARWSSKLWGALPISLVLSAGWTQLSPATIQSLSKHDVVLLDESYLGETLDQISVVVGKRLAVSCRIEGTQLHMDGELEEILEDFEEDEPVDGDNDQPTAVLADIPIRVHFELGEKVIPLAELQTLGPGYVIDLGREIRRAVSIRANGRVIGEGELIDIDGRIGVSIQQIMTSGS